MKKKIKIISLILSVLMLCLFITACNKNNEQFPNMPNAEKLTIAPRDYQISSISQEFDYFDYDSENHRIIAHNFDEKSKLSDKIDVNLVITDNIRTAYEVEYALNDEIIYIAISVFDENENLLFVETAQATPFFYEDGSFDALLNIDGKTVFLSEILAGEQDNCFALTLTLGSLLAAKIIAGIIIAAKVTIVIAAVVAVGAVTYQLVKVTKDWIKEKEKEAEAERTKRPATPHIYYYARAAGDVLNIAAVPEPLSTAKTQMQTRHSSYWTPLSTDALALVTAASGGPHGPVEIDRDYNGSPIRGRYYHYHCLGRIYGGAHAWFGTPYAGVY